MYERFTARARKVIAIGVDDLPPELQAAAAALDAQIDETKARQRTAVAQCDFQNAAVLRDRADLLWRTKAAMCRYWMTHRPIAGSWLLANGGMALRLARRIQEQRDWAELQELADALIAAGCDDVEILDHLRQGGPHTNHCWVVDLLLANA